MKSLQAGLFPPQSFTYQDAGRLFIMHFTSLKPLIWAGALISTTIALPVVRPEHQLLSLRVDAESDKLSERKDVELIGRAQPGNLPNLPHLPAWLASSPPLISNSPGSNRQLPNPLPNSPGNGSPELPPTTPPTPWSDTGSPQPSTSSPRSRPRRSGSSGNSQPGALPNTPGQPVTAHVSGRRPRSNTSSPFIPPAVSPQPSPAPGPSNRNQGPASSSSNNQRQQAGGR